MPDTTTVPTPTEISATTINEMVRRFPATVAAFNHHGIDSCCGGAAQVADAAVRDGADTDALVSEIIQLIMESK